MTDETRLARLLTLRRRINADITRLEARITATPTRTYTRRRREKPTHGTDAGYYHHRRITRTQPCDDCKAAHAVAERVRRLQREQEAREREAAA